MKADPKKSSTLRVAGILEAAGWALMFVGLLCIVAVCFSAMNRSGTAITFGLAALLSFVSGVASFALAEVLELLRQIHVTLKKLAERV